MQPVERNMPDVWGAGELLAFSGLDGPTDAVEPFVLHTDTRPGDLLVRLPLERHVRFEGLTAFTPAMILGDVIVADSTPGPYCCAFTDRHTLIGETGPDVPMSVDGQPVADPCRPCGDNGELGLFAARRGPRWCLVVDRAGNAAGAGGRCAEALEADLPATVSLRSSYVRRVAVPPDLDANLVRLLRKAVSVMKVNVEAPAGRITRRWTTPDRWPHRHMWLWDSGFHAIGLSHVDPPAAQDALLAMLEQLSDDGMLPHMIPVREAPSQVTQPPVLAWAVREVFRRTGDADWARECTGYLLRYLEWMRTNRDRNDNGVPEWHVEGSSQCRCGESGLDNSPRFDRDVLLDAVDFGSWLSHDYACLADLARALAAPDMERTCRAHAERVGAAVNAVLWCEEEGLYLDRRPDGTFLDVKAVSSFMPLFAGIAERDQAERLHRHLRDPHTFGTPLPVPSVSLDAGTFCRDMWRGPTWMNLNYMVYCGLRRYGFDDGAAQLKAASLSAVAEWYQTEGCLWEFYDSLGLTSPRRLDRKQRLRTGEGIGPISDYHWTAAVTAAWLLEDCGHNEKPPLGNGTAP